MQNSHELAGFIVLQNLYSLPGVYTPSRKIGWAASATMICEIDFIHYRPYGFARYACLKIFLFYE